MQRRKRYGLGYLLVLLAAVGGFLIARDAASGIQPPSLALPGDMRQIMVELDVFGLAARLLPALPSATPTRTDTPPRAATPAIVQGIEPTATARPAAPGPAPVDTPAPQPTAPAEAAYAFVLAGPVRHNSDCASASIRGSVRDAAGSLLAGVRLWRYDQWGNEDVIESRGGDAERGQYDFPLGDTANRHYVQVIDAGGAIISPVVQIDHRQGDAAEALCHWVDWQRQ
jgi:hypothetical protein